MAIVPALRVTYTVNELTKEYLAARNGVAVADLPLYDKYVQQYLLIYTDGITMTLCVLCAG
jgi:hypothetical protein